MSNSAKRYLIAATLLLTTAFITFGAYSTRKHSGMLYTREIPIMIGDWYGKDLPMDERTYDILETKDALMREYVNSNNEKVLLVVVFSQSNRKVSHPPEVCFAGNGWTSTNRETQTFIMGSQMVKANRLILQKGSEKQVLLYLYKAGGELTNSYNTQQLNIILNGMFRRDISSALIRMSCSANGDDVEEPMKLLIRFTKDIIPILEEHLP